MYAKKIIGILFLFYCWNSYGQTTSKEYLDKSMKKTDTLANAVYYRLEKKDVGGRVSEVKTYYMNDSLESEQYYTGGKPSGLWMDYHRNGKKAGEKEYKNDGTQTYQKWYENGQMKEEGGWQPKPEKKRNQLVVNNFWDSTGVQTVVNGNGSLTEYNGNTVFYRETYSNGELVKGIRYDEDGTEWLYDTDREKMPEFPGGLQAMYTFMSSNIKFPEEARKNKVRGKVYVSFVIGSDGMVKDVTTLGKKLGYGCEEEAMRVVSMMPKWSPGIQDGKAVPVRFQLPLTFNLYTQK